MFPCLLEIEVETERKPPLELEFAVVAHSVLVDELEADPHPHAAHRNPDVRVDEELVVDFVRVRRRVFHELHAHAGVEEYRKLRELVARQHVEAERRVSGFARVFSGEADVAADLKVEGVRLREVDAERHVDVVERFVLELVLHVALARRVPPEADFEAEALHDGSRVEREEDVSYVRAVRRVFPEAALSDRREPDGPDLFDGALDYELQFSQPLGERQALVYVAEKEVDLEHVHGPYGNAQVVRAGAVEAAVVKADVPVAHEHSAAVVGDRRHRVLRLAGEAPARYLREAPLAVAVAADLDSKILVRPPLQPAPHRGAVQRPHEPSARLAVPEQEAEFSFVVKSARVG